MLPASNQLINMLAVSGMPADRFAIEYFPVDLESTLIKRKPMKMTVAMMVSREELRKVLETTSRVYGKQHVVFVESRGDMVFRGEV